MTPRVPSVRVELLGPGQVLRDGTPVSLSPFQVALIAFVYGEGRASRADVCRALWPEAASRRVRQRLRQLLTMVKRKVGTELLAVSGDFLTPADGVDCDLFEVRDQLTGGEVQEAAASLRHGFLRFSLAPLHDRFHDWRDLTEAHLRRSVIRQAMGVWEERSRAGAWQAARGAAEALYILSPSEEDTVSRVIHARARCGRYHQAEAAYADYLEGGPEAGYPSDDLVALMERIRALPAATVGTSEPAKPAFVGRVSELQVLAESMETIRAGKPAIVVIEGEAGMGKSRLLEEAARIAALDGIRCLNARCAELEQVVSLNPVIDALLGIDIDAILDGLGEPWRSVVGAHLPSGTLREPVNAPPPIQDQNLPRRLMDAMCMTFDGIANEKPSVLLLDDAHWADATTLALVNFFGRRGTDTAFGVVMTRRVDPRDPSSVGAFTPGDEVPVTLITLESLSHAEAVELVTSLGDTCADGETADTLVSLADRHPLYLTELARDYLAGRWAPPQSSQEPLAVPVSLRDLLARRSAHLSQLARAVAAFLSVGPRTIRLTETSRVLGISIDEVVEGAEELERAGLLGLYRGEARITHDLYRAAIYDGLTDTRRAHLHLLHAQRLEAEASDDSVGTLATHYDRAGESERAAAFGWTAGHTALERGAMAEAAHFFELVTLNESDPTRRAEATANRALALYRNRDMRRATSALEMASRRLREIGRSGEARLMEIRRIEGLRESGEASATEILDRLRDIKSEATAAKDWEAVAVALDNELRVRSDSEDRDGVPRVFDEIRRVLHLGGPRAAAVCHASLAMQVLYGEAAQALQAAWRAVDLARSSADLRLPALLRLMAVLQFRGELALPENEPVLEEARLLAAASGDLRIHFSIESNLALFFLDAGELDIAEGLLERSSALLGSADMSGHRFNQAYNRAELGLARGHYESAQESFEQARGFVGRSSVPRYAVRAVEAGVGLCALQSGDLALARSCEALVGDLEPSWYFDPGTLVSFKVAALERRGDRTEALRLLRQATSYLEGRLDLAWLKLAKLEVEKRLKWGQTEELQPLVKRCVTSALELNLQRRAAEFQQIGRRLGGET